MGDNVVDLLSGTRWAPGPTGVTNVSYAFWQQTPSYDTFPPENTGFQPFTDSMKLAVTNAAYDPTSPISSTNMPGVLDYIETIANIQFTNLPAPAAGDLAAESAVQIGYGMAYIDRNAEAYTYYPDTRALGPLAGDVWANRTYYTVDSGGAPDPNALHVVPGDYDWLALWHETGHALGLKHPFEKPHQLPSNLESDQYTVMSYTHSSHYTAGIYPETLMPLDILAIQHTYGANMTAAPGSDIYVLNPDHIYTIWDTGGTDTFDGSLQTTNEVIDLRDGHYSTINSATSMTQNIAIAYGTVIENATGGSGDDVIYDNGVTNTITTGDGNNTVWLTLGDDTVIGGSGDDTIHMGVGNESVDGGAGTDTLVFNTSESNFIFDNSVGSAVYHGYTYTFVGDETFQFTDGTFNGFAPQVLSGAGTIKGGLGDDTITGTGAGTHILSGLAGDDQLMGGPLGSVDRMYGGSGNDTYLVDNAKDVCVDLVNNPAGGLDTVDSSVSYTLGAGVDNLTFITGGNLIGKGNTLNNVLTGGAGNDTLSGSSGNDTLEGGLGANTLIGGTGADIFMFHAGDIGATPDAITDFSIKSGDKLDISSVLTGFDPLNLDDFVHLTVSGVSTIVSIDADGAANGVSFTDIATLVKVHGLDAHALLDAGNLIA